MKKFLALLLAGLLLTLCFVGCGEDEVGDDGEPDLTLSNDLVYDGFEYETNDEGNYSIVGYRIEQEAVVTVPSEINGRPVTGIGDGAFKANKMSGIIIPDSIKTIGSTAFYDCDNLTTVTIPDSVTSLGANLFDKCDKLTAVTLPSSLTALADYTFMNCPKLTTVAIPETVTAIGKGCFQNCTALTALTLPASLTAVGDCAFYGSAVAELALPASLTAESIGQYLVAMDSATVLVVAEGSAAAAYAEANQLNYRLAD